MTGESPAAALAGAGDRLGAVLFSAALQDQFGQWYDAHRGAASLPLSGYRALQRRNDVLLVLDGAYDRIDDAFEDLVAAGGR